MVRTCQAVLLGAVLFIMSVSISWAQEHQPITADQQQALTPNLILHRLMTGNMRYVKDTLHQTIHAKDALLTAKHGQHPKALILNCVDSRSIPNYVFDQRIGNIFVARVAGNVADTNILGSMEFAAVHAGVKVIVIMGHTQCGAVVAACHGSKTGQAALDQLLNQIRPAVLTVKHQEGNQFNCDNPKTINAIAKQNVLNQVHYVLNHSADLAHMEETGKLLIVGAMHNIKTGKVHFFNLDGHAIHPSKK